MAHVRAVLAAASLVALVFATSCAGSPPRSAKPVPKAFAPLEVPPPSPSSAAPETGPPSPFRIVVRGPMPEGDSSPVDYTGHPFPLVQRLPGGGLVVASEYARAQAEGSGPLRVDLLYEGLEEDVFGRHSHVNGGGAIRWVWAAGPDATFAMEESSISRVGESSVVYRLNKGRWQVLRRNASYQTVVLRGAAVLALERLVKVLGKGSDATPQRDRARISLLAGNGPVPTLPRGFCPTTMSAAPDGSLLVVGYGCTSAEVDDGAVRALRFAPNGAQAIAEPLPRNEAGDSGALDGPPVVLAVSKDDLWVADASLLVHWDGKSWSSTRPFGEGHRIRSLSKSRDGALWAVVHEGELGGTLAGRVLTRASGSAEWKAVPLPAAPLDPLDPEGYTDLMYSFAYAREDGTDPQVISNPLAATHLARELLLPLRVDADGDDVLVLAAADGEAFVLSTRERGEVARLPSQNLQRARSAGVARRRNAKSVEACGWYAILVFPEATSEEALRRALPPLPDMTSAAASTVEGRTRLVVYGMSADVDAAMKKLAALKPRLVCGPAVIERHIER